MYDSSTFVSTYQIQDYLLMKVVSQLHTNPKENNRVSGCSMTTCGGSESMGSAILRDEASSSPVSSLVIRLSSIEIIVLQLAPQATSPPPPQVRMCLMKTQRHFSHWGKMHLKENTTPMKLQHTHHRQIPIHTYLQPHAFAHMRGTLDTGGWSSSKPSPNTIHTQCHMVN